ncbi:ribosome biogenesis GTPase YlqF [Ideonella livida]|uniref:Ribosome biogenesis GTPase A n=1 Tax=Ideonella livida TaxID=2707176 RepID=A0A7C9TNY8_9BURK|nr:ribosome biogenesis GTPase YlqF [Ideonella livida]NDY93006.1 ribosome biogenesis GTPase YlqF [Ideonella livida]
MSVQWFPGHMHATRKAITERMKQGIDVVIELLDARLPGSSCNPLLAELTAGKPSLKVLNKQDLADADRTARWLAHYRAQHETGALALDASERAPAARLAEGCRALAPLRGGMDKPLRILICGVPNVGKSTLINTLVGKKATKTGDVAGVTRNEQRITLASDAYLFDTPGMLWPKITVPKSGFHLAASGAVGANAYDEQEVALELLETLQPHYAAVLQSRYGLKESPEEVAALPSERLLEAIGRRRSAVRAGGVVDLHKAAEVLIADFRAGAMGRITLETPEELAAWRVKAEAEEAARLARKQALKEAGLIRVRKPKAEPQG